MDGSTILHAVDGIGIGKSKESMNKSDGSMILHDVDGIGRGETYLCSGNNEES